MASLATLNGLTKKYRQDALDYLRIKFDCRKYDSKHLKSCLADLLILCFNLRSDSDAFKKLKERHLFSIDKLLRQFFEISGFKFEYTIIQIFHDLHYETNMKIIDILLHFILDNQEDENNHRVEPALIEKYEKLKAEVDHLEQNQSNSNDISELEKKVEATRCEIAALQSKLGIDDKNFDQIMEEQKRISEKQKEKADLEANLAEIEASVAQTTSVNQSDFKFSHLKELESADVLYKSLKEAIEKCILAKHEKIRLTIEKVELDRKYKEEENLEESMEKPKENFKSKIALCEQKLKLINDQNIKLAKELGLPISDFLNTQNIESEILKGLHNYCKKSSEFCKSKRKMLAARGLENAENYKKCNDVITRKVQDEKDKLSELDQKTKYIANYLESNREVLEEIGLNIPDLSQYKNTEDE